MYKLDIIIPALPKRINQTAGRHWRVKHKESKKWVRLVGAHVRWNFPKQALKKAKLTLIRGSSVEPDPDNLAHSFKSVCDALVKLNIIIDDKTSVIGKPDYQWVKATPRKGFVRVIVEEQEPEDIHDETDQGITSGAA